MALSKILVMLDGSESAEGILDYVRLVADESSEVTLCTAETEDDDRMRHLKESYLELRSGQLSGNGFKTKITVRCGDAIEQIAAHCGENPVELVMPGDWMMPVALKLLGSLAVPLMLVRAGVRPPAKMTRVLVPLDGSFVSEAVLPAVLSLTLNADVEVILLSVNETPEVCSDYAAGADSAHEQYCQVLFTEIRQQATAYLEGIKSSFTRQGTAARPMVVFGSVAEMIDQVAAAEQVSLIAMATHGRTGLDRFLHGSVSETLLQTSQLPIILVCPK